MPLAEPINATDHIRGNAQAPLILLEYGDYACPFCARANEVVARLEPQFGVNLAYVFRNFPLVQIHPDAVTAAAAAEAAGMQGKFWEMHDYLYRHQEEGLDQMTLFEIARDVLELNLTQFERDITSRPVERKIRRDLLSGRQDGVEGTPTFFVNGEKVRGGWGFENLSNALEQQLQDLGRKHLEPAS